MKRILALALVAVALPACSDSTGPGANRVSVRFATASATRSALLPASADVASGGLTVTGGNGTLAIDDIRLIVSKLELERAEGSCATTTTATEHDCEEVHAPPSLLVLPLDGTPVTVSTTDIPAGTYTGLKFKVEDEKPESDEPAASQQALQAILTQLRAAYPNFPVDASMVVHGTFTPAGGAAQPFTVYFRAEVEVEKPLDPPVTVPGTTALTVTVDPSLWFKSGTNVLNLAQLNGQTVEFEAEAVRGFAHVEHDH